MTEATDPAPPAVSVIVPTYQRRELVTRAVESVLAQSFRDLEVIVVDDGSTDGTEAALAALGQGIQYRWQENRGVSAARNAGIALARGEIVAFLDSDNRWLPDHLEVVVDTFDRHPEAVLVSTCPGFDIRGKDGPAAARVVDALGGSVLGNVVGYLSCAAVRRQALLVVAGFDEQLPVAEDDDLWLRLAMRGPFALVRRRTVVRRATPSSLKERGRRSGQYIAARERTLARAIGELERTGQRDLVAQARAELAFAAFLGALSRHDTDTARRALHDAVQLWPRLSHAPGILVGRIRDSAWEPADVLYRFAGAASLWPDPQAATPLFLRAYAVMLALRCGRLRQAGRLAAAEPRCLSPRHLAGRRRLIALLTRQWLSERRPGGG